MPENEAQPINRGQPLHLTVADFERTIIENALRAAGGNITRLEQSLGTACKTLYDKLSRYGLRPRDFR